MIYSHGNATDIGAMYSMFVIVATSLKINVVRIYILFYILIDCNRLLYYWKMEVLSHMIHMMQSLVFMEIFVYFSICDFTNRIIHYPNLNRSTYRWATTTLGKGDGCTRGRFLHSSTVQMIYPKVSSPPLWYSHNYCTIQCLHIRFVACVYRYGSSMEDGIPPTEKQTYVDIKRVYKWCLDTKLGR